MKRKKPEWERFGIDDILDWLAEHHPPWWIPIILSVAALIKSCF